MKNSTNISFFRSQRFIFLSLFMTLALVPVILFGGITYWQATTNLTNMANENLAQMGLVQHQRIHDWLQNVEAQVAVLAKDDEIISMDPEEATGAIVSFSETLQTLEAVILADPTGRIIAADSEAPFRCDKMAKWLAYWLL
jgi:hypothetical protein